MPFARTNPFRYPSRPATPAPAVNSPPNKPTCSTACARRASCSKRSRPTAACPTRMPDDEWVRLKHAVARVHNPDRLERRRGAARRSARGATRRTGATTRCATTRASASCAASPCSPTPNYFPPRGLRRRTATRRARAPRSGRAAALLRLQAEVLAHPPLLRPAVPAVRGVQLREAHRARRPARPRRAADRRAREDRLPGRPQAAARGRAPHRHDALPARLGRALRARSPTSREWGASPRDLRPRPAPHAERRGVLPRAARDARRGSTSSSTTPARPCAVRPSSTST